MWKAKYVIRHLDLYNFTIFDDLSSDDIAEQTGKLENGIVIQLKQSDKQD